MFDFQFFLLFVHYVLINYLNLYDLIILSNSFSSKSCLNLYKQVGKNRVVLHYHVTILYLVPFSILFTSCGNIKFEGNIIADPFLFHISNQIYENVHPRNHHLKIIVQMLVDNHTLVHVNDVCYPHDET